MENEGKILINDKENKCVSLGEIGLDYHYDGYDEELQKSCFRAQMALAEKQEREFVAWLNKKIASMYIYIAPEFRNGEFQNKNWVKYCKQ